MMERISWGWSAVAIAAALILVAFTAERTMPALSMFDSAPKVLYATAFVHDPKGWVASSGSWKTRDGILTYNGANSTTYLAPFRLTGKRYTVEASIRLVRYRGLGYYTPNSFGILFRSRPAVTAHGRASGLGGGIFETVASSGQTYSAAIITSANNPAVDNANFNFGQYDPTTSWHTYRVVVNGDSLALRIDGKEVVTTAYSTFAGADRVGLFSATSQIEVRSFKVFSR